MNDSYAVQLINELKNLNFTLRNIDVKLNAIANRLR